MTVGIRGPLLIAASIPGWATTAATVLGIVAIVVYAVELLRVRQRLARRVEVRTVTREIRGVHPLEGPSASSRRLYAWILRGARPLGRGTGAFDVVNATGALVLLLVPSGLKVGLAVGLVVAAVLRFLVQRRSGVRGEPSTADRGPRTPTFRVSTTCEHVAVDPAPRHRVYLLVENEGPAAPFLAQVVQVSNSVTDPSVPWTIRWRESDTRELIIQRDAGELLDVVETVPMGRDPHAARMELGLMLAHAFGGDRELRIAAGSIDDLYVNEVGLAIEVTNTATGERQPVFLRVGMDNAPTLPPRLNLYREPPSATPDATNAPRAYRSV